MKLNFARMDRERVRWLVTFPLAAMLVAFSFSYAFAQKDSTRKPQKLPSPDKIVSDYLKAIGGKKRVAAVKDATYEWTLAQNNDATVRVGKALTQRKSPASTRTVVTLNDIQDTTASNAATGFAAAESEFETGANLRSAWMRDKVSGVRTLTDAQAQSVKLQSMLEASHLVDIKKAKILARTAGMENESGEPAYVVEFSLRNGARVRYWFSVSSKLLLASEDKAQNTVRRYSNYKPEGGLLEPHQVRWATGRGVEVVTLNLQSVRYNTGLSDAVFDPPAAELIDVAALLKEVDRNQEQIDERVGEYTYTERLTERKINDKGEVTEEKVKLFEVYPIPGGRDVHKLISENGVLLSPEKAAKEDKRVVEEMEKAQRERTKEAEKRERDKLKGKKEKTGDDDPGIADFLRSAELVSPRRERLRDRESIVFDFRPRVGYKPKGDIESIVSKLTGVMWIDPVDKQVMRLEARLIESYKIGGGLLASVRPGTALVFEQRRMEDGVWLPVFSQVNISAKVLLFKGINLNIVQEFSNYQRFKSGIDDYKLTPPEVKDRASPNP